MHQLLQKQNELHKEGASLLESLILPILKQYGEVHVGGSYSYQLLNHPDLDIDVVSESASKESYVKLCTELLLLDCVSKLKSADRVNFPHPHTGTRPNGFWISPTIHYGNSVWKLDIWLQHPDWHTGDTNRFATELATIDEATRITILSLKQELISQGIYGVGKEFESVDVYEGVLYVNVMTVEDLRTFTKSKRSEIIP